MVAIVHNGGLIFAVVIPQPQFVLKIMTPRVSCTRTIITPRIASPVHFLANFLPAFSLSGGRVLNCPIEIYCSSIHGEEHFQSGRWEHFHLALASSLIDKAFSGLMTSFERALRYLSLSIAVSPTPYHIQIRYFHSSPMNIFRSFCNSPLSKNGFLSGASPFVQIYLSIDSKFFFSFVHKNVSSPWRQKTPMLQTILVLESRKRWN